jgi:hypothetical protein
MRMRVVFEDGTDYPLTVLKMGREVAWFEVDGTRYLRVAEPDWDDLAVTD